MSLWDKPSPSYYCRSLLFFLLFLLPLFSCSTADNQVRSLLEFKKGIRPLDKVFDSWKIPTSVPDPTVCPNSFHEVVCDDFDYVSAISLDGLNLAGDLRLVNRFLSLVASLHTAYQYRSLLSSLHPLNFQSSSTPHCTADSTALLRENVGVKSAKLVLRRVRLQVEFDQKPSSIILPGVLHSFVPDMKKMETEQKGDDNQQVASSSNVGLGGLMVERYRKIKEHAETYPYVWGSYAVVYGGCALWFAYRWRKLRKTEDRVRVKIETLRKLVEAEESTSSAAVTGKSPPTTDKTKI